MNIGSMRHRVTFLAQTTAQDSFGQQQTQWTPFLTTWGSIEVLKSLLKHATSTFVSRVTYTIIIRYPSQAITANNRISYTDRMGTHIYEIQSVENDKQINRQLKITAYELDGDQ